VMGLNSYVARYYDPTTGAFTTADSVAAGVNLRLKVGSSSQLVSQQGVLGGNALS
jgi:hypothetical protein